ncbi:MAG: DUF5009 domain-containing protein [Planctomycetota bacterium]
MSGVERAQRWLGLDALRGLTIAAMILVNNPGRWGKAYQYEPLTHADWHGCTFTDLVFPTFLFCAGVAIAPALGRRLAAGTPRSTLALAITRRSAVLVLLGLFLSAFPLVTFAPDKGLFAPLLGVRFPGVLQRIGVCYGLAALLFVFASVRTQRLVLLGCLLGYWALIALVPVPGLGPPDIDAPARTLQAWLDQAVFGSHIYREWAGDPEGILSTLPAVATCMFGVEAGRILRAELADDAKMQRLLGFGLVLSAIGFAWSFLLPLNKKIWTSSYAVWTAGIAALVLAATHRLAGGERWRRLLVPLQVYGVNALLVFMGSGIVGRILGSLWKVTVDGKEIAVKEWFFRTALLPWLPPKLASLAFALLWIAGWYLVLRALYRRGIVWKV